MSVSKKSGFAKGLNEPNITPLADVTTTLIVVFLITMPTIMWNGIQVNQAEAGSEQTVVEHTVKDKDELITIAVDPDGVRVNGTLVAIESLGEILRTDLTGRDDKTVVIKPHDAVELGMVVQVLDVAKASGATALALLNEKERG